MTGSRRFLVLVLTLGAAGGCDPANNRSDGGVFGGAVEGGGVDAGSASDASSAPDAGGLPPGPGPGPAPVCTPPNPADTCDRCLANLCCDELAACQRHADCNALFTCFRACDIGDIDCLEACVAKHPAGEPALLELFTCSDQCETECTMPDRLPLSRPGRGARPRSARARPRARPAVDSRARARCG